MKSSGRNETKEREMVIAINAIELDKALVDRRTGLRLGTIRQLCKQYGIAVKVSNGAATLKAKRDSIQLAVEKLYFCRIKYTAMS